MDPGSSLFALLHRGSSLMFRAKMAKAIAITFILARWIEETSWKGIPHLLKGLLRTHTPISAYISFANSKPHGHT